MLGIIITILGGITIYQLWGSHMGLAIFAIVATLYQASSLRELFREKAGLEIEDKWQTFINIISTVVIMGLLIYSFLI